MQMVGLVPCTAPKSSGPPAEGHPPERDPPLVENTWYHERLVAYIGSRDGSGFLFGFWVQGLEVVVDVEPRPA